METIESRIISAGTERDLVNGSGWVCFGETFKDRPDSIIITDCDNFKSSQTIININNQKIISETYPYNNFINKGEF